jgi:hypothetical protein
VPSCANVVNANFAPVTLALSETPRAIGTAVTIVLAKQSPVTMVFAGSIGTLTTIPLQPAVTVSVVISYVNAADTTTVYEQTVPILMSIPVAVGTRAIYIPVTSAIGACLPCGTYDVSVNFATAPSTAARVSVSGTLAITPYL